MLRTYAVDYWIVIDARHFRRKELIIESYHEVRNAMSGQLELFKKSHVLRT